MRSSSLTPVISLAVAIGVAITLLTVGFSHPKTEKAIAAATPAASPMTQHSGTSRRAAWARVSAERLRPAASMPSIVAGTRAL